MGMQFVPEQNIKMFAFQRFGKGGSTVYEVLSVPNKNALTKDCKVGEVVAVASHNTSIHFSQISLTTFCCPLCVINDRWDAGFMYSDVQL